VQCRAPNDTFVSAHQHGADPPADIGDDAVHGRRVFAEHDRGSWFDHRRLFGGNRFERISQEGFVVVVDRGDRGGHLREHVRGVEPAAEAHLDNGHVDACIAESLERQRGRRLEEAWRRRQTAGRIANPAGERVCRRRRDLTAVDRKSLLEVDQMGRRVASCPVAGGSQPPLHHCCHRAFSVRAGD
jgi:hypothetical protein